MDKANERVLNLQISEDVSGVMVNSTDFISGEYNSHIFNSLFGFPLSYYQMYLPNISFGHFGWST